MKSILTKSVEETQRLAEDIAGLLKNGDVLGFVGELGAGKTSFIQGLARGMHVPKNCYVSSPTFTILKIYKGDLDIYHFDLYRLDSDEEFEDLGVEDYLKDGGIAVIEWADKFARLLPKNTMEIRFKVLSENEREIIIPRSLII